MGQGPQETLNVSFDNQSGSYTVTMDNLSAVPVAESDAGQVINRNAEKTPPGSWKLTSKDGDNAYTVSYADNAPVSGKSGGIHILEISSVMLALKSLAALAFASYAAAILSISGPNNNVVGAKADVAWVSTPQDPQTFTLLLWDGNPVSTLPTGIRQNFGEFKTASGGATIPFNSNLPTSNINYVLRAVNTDNLNQVYSTSGSFVLTRFAITE
ncbi:hypothetical protein L218DRAFT_1081290, partial [Marasmius fiardii PR-910]